MCPALRRDREFRDDVRPVQQFLQHVRERLRASDALVRPPGRTDRLEVLGRVVRDDTTPECHGLHQRRVGAADAARFDEDSGIRAQFPVTLSKEITGEHDSGIDLRPFVQGSDVVVRVACASDDDALEVRPDAREGVNEVVDAVFSDETPHKQHVPARASVRAEPTSRRARDARARTRRGCRSASCLKRSR